MSRFFDWIDLPAYRFWMGGGPRAEENPRHLVRVPAFRLARTQVTRELYQRFLDATGVSPPPFWDEPNFCHPRLPAVGPSHDDALLFCRWAGEESGELVRLPSEAEWEAAARAGRDVTWPWGEDPPESLEDYESRWIEGPEIVDAYPSSHPLGFLGLGENVHEWCADWYGYNSYEASAQEPDNPKGPLQGVYRVLRGGCWKSLKEDLRCSRRHRNNPGTTNSTYGFRCATDVA